MSTVYLISRRPRLVLCARCGVMVLTGIDEGLPYTVDPIPLSIEGELIARLANRWTYEWYMGQATYRNVMRMRRKPRPVVLAKHKCGESLIEMADESRIAQMTRFIHAHQKFDQPLSDTKGSDFVLSCVETLNARVIDDPPY